MGKLLHDEDDVKPGREPARGEEGCLAHIGKKMEPEDWDTLADYFMEEAIRRAEVSRLMAERKHAHELLPQIKPVEQAANPLFKPTDALKQAVRNLGPDTEEE